MDIVVSKIAGFLAGAVEGYLFLPCLFVGPVFVRRLVAPGQTESGTLVTALGVTLGALADLALFVIVAVAQQHLPQQAQIPFGKACVIGFAAGTAVLALTIGKSGHRKKAGRASQTRLRKGQ